MLDILEKWNRWGTHPLKSGRLRHKTSDIIPYLHTDEVIALIGSRRAGKSTILYQLVDVLESEGVPRKAILHMNFEEPKLTPNLNVKMLDQLYDCYREHVYPEGKAFLFLDEIQVVEDWERWVRARNETENVKIFITGSSSKLLSREIASLLTGRHLSFEVFPLSFSEYLEFNTIPLPKHRRATNASPPIKQALNGYLQWGGFPAVTLAKSDQHKRDILMEYFDDMLYKDIVSRHQIRDVMGLRNVAVHLLTQTSTLVSFQRVGKIFHLSDETATNYCRYLQEAFLLELVPYFSLKASLRQRHPHKIHAIDLGLRNSVSLAHSADEGHLIETLVYQSLRRKYHDNVFYWSGKYEIDFVIREGNTITQLWQVVSGGLDDEQVRTRELRAISEAQLAFPNATPHLITKTLPLNVSELPVDVVPLWLLLMSNQ